MNVQIYCIKDVTILFEEQMNKHRYIPDTLEEFLRYSEPTYIEENEAFNMEKDYFINKCKFDLRVASIQTLLV